MLKYFVCALITLSTTSLFAGTNDVQENIKLLYGKVPQFTYCLQTEIDRSSNPDEIEGIFTFNFSIGYKGSVANPIIRTNDNISDSTLECIRNVFNEIQFVNTQMGSTILIYQDIKLYPTRPIKIPDTI